MFKKKLTVLFQKMINKKKYIEKVEMYEFNSLKLNKEKKYKNIKIN